MRNYICSLVMLASSVVANASTLGAISLSGVDDTFTATGITFVGDSPNSFVQKGTGVFAPYTFSVGTLYSFNFDSTAAGQVLFQGSDLSFTILTANVPVTYMTDFLNETGTGTFSWASNTMFATGTYNLTSTTNTITSFTIDASAFSQAQTPEPFSITMVGTSILVAAGALRRRFLV